MSLTHFDDQGQAHMVDVAAKQATHRIAVAQGRITMLPATLELIASGSAKKGEGGARNFCEALPEGPRHPRHWGGKCHNKWRNLSHIIMQGRRNVVGRL